MKLYYILLFVFIGAVMNKNIQKEIDDLRKDKRMKVLSKLVEKKMIWDPTDRIEGYIFVARRITVDIKQFKNYGDVRIVTVKIDWDVSAARFSFKAKTIGMKNIGYCETKDVIVNLKRASYPAVNPDNYRFPEAFISPHMREHVHSIELHSSGQMHHLDIERPKPGYWYVIVYIKWIDPKMEKLEQKGLNAECETVLFTSLQVKTEEYIEVIDCYTGLKIDYVDLPAYFKCMTSDSIESIHFNLTVTKISINSKIIMFSLQALTLPTKDDSIITCVFDPKLNHKHTITFSPNTKVWHYLFISYISNNLGYSDCETFYSRKDPVDRNITVIDLMRDDKGRHFTFEFGLPTTSIKDASSLIDITTKEMKTVRFQVNYGVDIGGTLMIKASMLPHGLRDDKFPYKIVVCLNVGFASIPLESGVCAFNNQIKQALFQLYITDHVNTDANKVLVPFPESGNWYLTFRMFYSDEEFCFCRTPNSTRRYKNSLEYKKPEDKLTESSKFAEEMHQNQKAAVVLTVKSMLCIEDCSDNGDCKLQYKDTMMSFCECKKGYGGWDCSDESRMDSKVLLILAVLLLTLSNLFFLLTIYVAIIRRYFAEGAMYTLTMFFSAFYHMCDAPGIVKECIVDNEFLQYGDFYCGNMCFLVTLLAMSIISEVIRTTLQLVGAITIGILIFWDKHSLVTFISPLISGLVILFSSWLWDHGKKHTFRYAKQYYRVYLPIGLSLVSIGLICFAFLQTEENYKIVHSFWHVLIALSVVFLLPDVRREADAHPFKPSPGFFKM